MKNCINLLPKEHRRRVMLRIRVWQWAGIWCLVAATCAVLGWSGYREHIHVESELDQIERTYHPTAVLIEELKAMRAEAITFSKQESVAAELEDPRSALTLLGVVSKAARVCQGRVQVVGFKLDQVGRAGIGAGMQTGHLHHLLVLRGNALDMTGPLKFFDELKKADIFAYVKSKGTTNEEIFGQRLSVFHVECGF